MPPHPRKEKKSPISLSHSPKPSSPRSPGQVRKLSVPRLTATQASTIHCGLYSYHESTVTHPPFSTTKLHPSFPGLASFLTRYTPVRHHLSAIPVSPSRRVPRSSPVVSFPKTFIKDTMPGPSKMADTNSIVKGYNQSNILTNRRNRPNTATSSSYPCPTLPSLLHDAFMLLSRHDDPVSSSSSSSSRLLLLFQRGVANSPVPTVLQNSNVNKTPLHPHGVQYVNPASPHGFSDDHEQHP